MGELGRTIQDNYMMMHIYRGEAIKDLIIAGICIAIAIIIIKRKKKK